MIEVLNCDGMTVEQARAAVRAHCRNVEATLKAKRAEESAHRQANSERLGIIGGQPSRPKRYPARHGWQKLIHNGEQATGVLYRSEWRCFETEHVYKLLSFVSVIRRHKCYAWQIQLEGQDLTKETAWLEASDIDKITGMKIHFRNGFILESRDDIAIAVPRSMTEAEIQAESAILDVAEGMEGTHKKPTPAQREAQDAPRQSGFSNQAHAFIEQAWPEFKAMRKGNLRASRLRFIKHERYAEECKRYGIRTGDDVRKIQDTLRKQK